MFSFLLLLLLQILSSSASDDVQCTPQSAHPTKHVICYYEGTTVLSDINICQCTHFIFTNHVRLDQNLTVHLDNEVDKNLQSLKKKKEDLKVLFTLHAKPKQTAAILKSGENRDSLIENVVNLFERLPFDGIELNLLFDSKDKSGKTQISLLVKGLKLKLGHHRVKRGEKKMVEELVKDRKEIKIKVKTKKSRKTRESGEIVEVRSRAKKVPKEEPEEEYEEEEEEEDERELFIRLPVKPELIAKKFDLKSLSKYSDIMVVPTHQITDDSEKLVTYHPSRLMGLSDMLNADSILDLLTGLGAPKSKLAITLPANVLKFQLADMKKNTPRSPVMEEPAIIGQTQLCHILYNGNFTIERDEDLTAPYAFSDKTWLAFEDKISANIKGKYVLLRELAGASVYPIDSEDHAGICSNNTKMTNILTHTLHETFTKMGRKPREVVLQSLQQEIHDTEYYNYEGGVKLSEYRIVRVVDHSGAVHVIRKNTKTQFECSRQGYFSHPLGCNKFYRCVKFDQYSDDYTVFEYDCPAGLAFDERWEVCVWPGSLPHGAPCTGSSEIAPVPRAHYACPNVEGYFADPENCRWFFACLDHARDGLTPLTAYEFRCPFGLVFDEEKLACDWPWLVGGCGARGISGVVVEQYGRLHSGAQTAQVISHGAKAGFGYIAGGYDDHQEKASFATLPDYQVSGGRSLYSAGVVLDQRVKGKGPGGVLVENNVLASPVKPAVVYETLSTYQGAVGVSEGYTYAKPSQKFLPSVAVVSDNSRLVQATPAPVLLEHKPVAPVLSYTPQVVTPKSVVYQDQVLYGEKIRLSSPQTVQLVQPAVTPKPVLYAPTIAVAQKPVTLVQPVAYDAKLQIQSPRPVVYAHPIAVTPRPAKLVQPVVQQVVQPIIQVQSPKTVVYEQPIAVTPKPLTLVQPVVNKQVLQVPSPRPVFYEQPLAVTPKPATLVQPVVHQPVIYEQRFQVPSSKPVLYEQPIAVTPKPVALVQPVVQQVSRPVVFEQKLQVQSPRPVIYEQPLAVTPKPATLVQPVVQQPVFYEQRLQVTSPRPAVYKQSVTPKPVTLVQPVVYEQRVQVPSPRPIIAVTPKPAPVLKPVVYEQHVAVTPTPATLVQPGFYEQPLQVPPPRPVVYQQQVSVTPKPTTLVQPVVYEQRLNVPSPRPVVYEQPKPATVVQPVVYEHQVSFTPKPATLVQPVVYEQRLNVPSPRPVVYEQPKPATVVHPVVYEQRLNVPSPKPVIYEQPIAVAPKPTTVVQPVVYKQHISVTPKPKTLVQPVLYEQRLNVPSPKPVVYEYEQPIAVTPKPAAVVQPVVYEQRVQVPSPKPIVYQQQISVTPKPAAIVQPVSYEQQLQVPSYRPVVHEQPITATPKPVTVVQPVFYDQRVPVTPPRPVIYQQQISTPSPRLVVTPKQIPAVQPVVYEQQVPVPQAPIQRVQPVVYKQEVTLQTPRPVLYNPKVQLVSPKARPFKVQQPIFYEQQSPVVPVTGTPIHVTSKPVVYQQQVEISTPKTIINTPKATIYEHEYIPNVVINGRKEAQVLQYDSPKIYQEVNIEPAQQVIQRGQQEYGQKLVFEQKPAVLFEERPVAPAIEVKAAKPAVYSPQVVYEEEYIQQPKSTIKVRPQVKQSVYLSPKVEIQQQIQDYIPIRYAPKTQIVNEFISTNAKRPKIVYSNSYERRNPVESVLKSEIVNDVTQRPIIVQNIPEVQKEEYLTQVNFGVENRTYSSDLGYQYEVPRSDYVFDADIRIASPPAEYFDVTPTKTTSEQYLVELTTEKEKSSTGYVIKPRGRKPTTENIRLKNGKEYLPPTVPTTEEYGLTRKRPNGKKSKTTVITIGEVDSDEIDDGNVDELLNKYSGKYGDLLIDDKDKFVTKVVKGEGKGEIKVGKEPGVSTVGYEVTSSRTRQRKGRRKNLGSTSTSTTTSGYEEYDSDVDITTTGSPDNTDTADVSLASLDLKNLKLKKDKKTVIVVSQVSDSNPLLIGKLAGQCSCQSNEVALRRKSKRPQGSQNREDSNGSSDQVPNIRGEDVVRPRGRARPKSSDEGDAPFVEIGGQESYPYNVPIDMTTSSPRGRRPHKLDLDRYPENAPSRRKPANVQVLTSDSNTGDGPYESRSTTLRPIIPLALSEIQDQEPVARPVVRVKSRPKVVSSPIDQPLFSPISAEDIASTIDYQLVPDVSTNNEIPSTGYRRPKNKNRIGEGESKTRAGAAFDRYGPGGWRGADETLQGSVDCQRPGLFRHPKYCNKFYTCNYDQWKKRYTLHVFNCPVHLAYDSNLGACNWPSKGPACVDDNILV